MLGECGINIIEFLKFRKKYSFDVNVMVLLSLLISIEAMLTLLSMAYLPATRGRLVFWVVVFIMNTALAELALHKKWESRVRSIMVYGFTFGILPAWVFVHGNIVLSAILYIVMLLLALNIIATKVQRFIINPVVLAFIVFVMGYEYYTHKFIVVMPIEGELALYYIVVIPVMLTVGMFVVISMIDKYKNEHILLEEKNLELQQLMRIDMLTGLYNKQFLNEQIKMLMSISRRTQVPLSVLVVDIDYFKNYNDRYGHIQGDHCLVRVAEEIRNSVMRDSDSIFRFGGEEFVVLLHNVTCENAKIVGQRLVDNVRSAKISNSGSLIEDHITVSVGLYTFNGKMEMTTNSVIRMADEALYQAKNSGRNRLSTIGC